MMHFIGYPVLEDLLEHTDCQLQAPREPVYALLSNTSVAGQLGVTRHAVAITVVRLIDYDVHYCRIPLGRFDALNGEVLDEKHAWRSAIWEDAWRIVQEWLTEHGYTVVKATVAVPKDLTLLDGRADFLEYDKDVRVYVRKDRVPAQNP